MQARRSRSLRSRGTTDAFRLRGLPAVFRVRFRSFDQGFLRPVRGPSQTIDSSTAGALSGCSGKALGAILGPVSQGLESSADPAEIAKFEALAHRFWDSEG